jgi:ornithine cyclodeaminase/alanine dehydrogenase-like protein (mu-crystallin family)
MCTARADLRRQRIGRQHADERSVFKSVGTALEYLAAAILVYEGCDGRT